MQKAFKIDLERLQKSAVSGLSQTPNRWILLPPLLICDYKIITSPVKFISTQIARSTSSSKLLNGLSKEALNTLSSAQIYTQ